MDKVERVARALAGPRADEMVLAGNQIGEPCEYPKWMLHQLDAQAAIAAMQADAAPVAWMYVHPEGHFDVTKRRDDPLLPSWQGWTETPLYAHPPVDDRVSTSSPVNDRGSGNTSDKLRDAVKVDEDYELASRMIGAYEDFISSHRVERIRLAADILKRTRPLPYKPFWENPDGPGAA